MLLHTHYSDFESKCIIYNFGGAHYSVCYSDSESQATGPATQNARLPGCSLVLGTTKSPRTAKRKAERLGTVETGMHSSLR